MCQKIIKAREKIRAGRREVKPQAKLEWAVMVLWINKEGFKDSPIQMT